MCTSNCGGRHNHKNSFLLPLSMSACSTCHWSIIEVTFSMNHDHRQSSFCWNDKLISLSSLIIKCISVYRRFSLCSLNDAFRSLIINCICTKNSLYVFTKFRSLLSCSLCQCSRCRGDWTWPAPWARWAPPWRRLSALSTGPRSPPHWSLSPSGSSVSGA